MLRVPRLLSFALALAAAAPAAAQTPAAPTPGPVRLYIDCSYACDEAFLKREISYVDYMRDRRDADVHLLVTTRQTGSGGTEYTLKFIGLGRFAGVEQTLLHASSATATSDERRNALADLIKQGLVRYVSESSAGRRLKITVTPDTGGTTGSSGPISAAASTASSRAATARFARPPRPTARPTPGGSISRRTPTTVRTCSD